MYVCVHVPASMKVHLCIYVRMPVSMNMYVCVCVSACVCAASGPTTALSGNKLSTHVRHAQLVR